MLCCPTTEFIFRHNKWANTPSYLIADGRTSWGTDVTAVTGREGESIAFKAGKIKNPSGKIALAEKSMLQDEFGYEFQISNLPFAGVGSVLPIGFVHSTKPDTLSSPGNFTFADGHAAPILMKTLYCGKSDSLTHAMWRKYVAVDRVE